MSSTAAKGPSESATTAVSAHCEAEPQTLHAADIAFAASVVGPAVNPLHGGTDGGARSDGGTGKRTGGRCLRRRSDRFPLTTGAMR